MFVLLKASQIVKKYRGQLLCEPIVL